MFITKTTAEWLTDYGSQQSVGSQLRARRIAPLLELIEGFFHRYGYVTIIDIGGTAQYWRIVPEKYLRDHNVRITILNLPQIEMPKDFGPFRFVVGDGCDLSVFADQSFHIAHSNSVVEHVGDWERMSQYAREMSRVAESYFVQTPNYWFPIEPHSIVPFIHWLPKPIQIWLVLHFQLGHWSRATSIDQAVHTIEDARLLCRGMFQELFQEAQIQTERFFLFPKSFIAIKK